MKKYCATIAVFLLRITGALFNNISSMDRCPDDMCGDTPLIVDAISFSNGTVIITFSRPRAEVCPMKPTSYMTTYGCSQLGVIDQFRSLNTTNSSNFQRIDLPEEIVTSQDWECAFVVQAIIPLSNDISCITNCSACAIFNVSSYASHQSTLFEGNCVPISPCPRTDDVPKFALISNTSCSESMNIQFERPKTVAPYDISQGSMPNLYIVRDNYTGSEVCVNETYNNLTTLMAQCIELDPEDITLSCKNDIICVRLQARLSIINSTCEPRPATELPSTTATTASTCSKSTESINNEVWAIIATILMSLLFVTAIVTVIVSIYVCCKYHSHNHRAW